MYACMRKRSSQKTEGTKKHDIQTSKTSLNGNQQTKEKLKKRILAVTDVMTEDVKV